VRRTRANVAVACLLPIACTRVSDRERFEPQAERLEIVQTVPARGSVDVAADVRLDLCFSAYLDPRTPIDAPVTSGVVQVDAERSLQLSPWHGPGGAPARDDVGPWCEGSVVTIAPRAELMPGLLYRSRVAATLRGWNGEALDTEAPGWTEEVDGPRFYLEFTVAQEEGSTSSGSDSTGGSESSGGSSETGGEPMPEGPTLDDLFAEGGVFDPNRDICSCHRGDDELASTRLDLSSADTAYADLVVDQRPRDTGFPMVSLRRPSESFLVHKLLREKDGDALRGVLGDAMPKDGELPYADYVAIASWIEHGAQR
jgi:hypothetical protein